MHEEFIPFKRSVINQYILMAQKYKDKNALYVKGEYWSYEALLLHAEKMAKHFMLFSDQRCVILADKTVVAFAAILGTLLSGKSYTFLNKCDTCDRQKQIVMQTDTKILVVDEQNLPLAKKISRQLDQEISILCFNNQAECIYTNNISLTVSFHQVLLFPDYVYRYAYIMYTSGSTGSPKGVPISHNNLKDFLASMRERMQVSSMDRFIQIAELSFDISVHDMLTCWSSGACLYILPDAGLVKIAQYLNEHAITCWNSVPSVVRLIQSLQDLSQTVFPALRYSILCGETLTLDMVKVWRKMAPNSIIDNLYGPTEGTIFFTGYSCQVGDATNIVPIGLPLLHQEVALLDDRQQEVGLNDIGELYLSGTQIAEGYWQNDAATRSAFVSIKGKRFYKTGDLAIWDRNKGLIYKGRVDDQWKIRGYRVEKAELESEVKKIAQATGVAVVPIRNKADLSILKTICFVVGGDRSIEDIQRLCQRDLPGYMCPSCFIKLDDLPLNNNAKVDYRKLLQQAESFFNQEVIL